MVACSISTQEVHGTPLSIFMIGWNLFIYVRVFMVIIQYSKLFQGSFFSDNIEEWNRKLSMLLRDKEKLELVSREKKDRRDFEQLAVLASRMGLYRYLLFPLFIWFYKYKLLKI